MKRSILFWVLSILTSITVGGLIAWNTYVPNSEIRVTQAQIQTYIDTHLPQQGASVVLTAASLQCANNNLSTSFFLHTDEFAGHAYAVEVNVRGYPRYEATEGSFYFEPTDVSVNTKLTTNDGQPSGEVPSAQSSDPLLEMGRAIALKMDSLVRALIRGVIVNSLKKTPVYELPQDFLGATAAVFLQDITVVDGELVFSLTLARLGIFLLIALVVALLTFGTLKTSMRRPTLAFSLAALCLVGV